jgi:hypothetical protein
MVQVMHLFPEGTKIEPVFKSQADYEKWCDDFYKDVAPKLRELELARARSWEKAAHKIYF